MYIVKSHSRNVEPPFKFSKVNLAILDISKLGIFLVQGPHIHVARQVDYTLPSHTPNGPTKPTANCIWYRHLPPQPHSVCACNKSIYSYIPCSGKLAQILITQVPKIIFLFISSKFQDFCLAFVSGISSKFETLSILLILRLPTSGFSEFPL